MARRTRRLTELARRPVTGVAMPPPDRAGRVSAGHGAMVTLTGILGRVRAADMIEPEGLHLMIRPAQDAEDAAEPG